MLTRFTILMLSLMIVGCDGPGSKNLRYQRCLKEISIAYVSTGAWLVLDEALPQIRNLCGEIIRAKPVSSLFGQPGFVPDPNPPLTR